MAEEYRDMTKPYTEEEIQELIEHFKSLPTFDGTHIRTSDIAAQTKKMKWKLTPEQINAAVKFWDEEFGGKTSLEEHIKRVRAIPNPIPVFLIIMNLFDKNGDGTIQAQKVEKIIEYLKSQTAGLVNLQHVSFDDFLSSANKSKDELVKIEECVDWFKAKVLGQ